MGYRGAPPKTSPPLDPPNRWWQRLVRPAKLETLKDTGAVISVFCNLARTSLQLARRIWLANRIRKHASKASLGPDFRNVDISDSRLVVFVFEPRPNDERSADEAGRSEQVLTFIEGLVGPDGVA